MFDKVVEYDFRNKIDWLTKKKVVKSAVGFAAGIEVKILFCEAELWALAQKRLKRKASVPPTKKQKHNRKFCE